MRDVERTFKNRQGWVRTASGLIRRGISDLHSGHAVRIPPLGAKMIQIVALPAFRTYTLIGKVREHVTAVQTEPAVGLIEQAPTLPSLDKAKRDESKEQQRERKWYEPHPSGRPTEALHDQM